MSGEASKDVLRQTPPQLQEWIVSKQLNKTGQGDDDPATVLPIRSVLSAWGVRPLALRRPEALPPFSFEMPLPAYP